MALGNNGNGISEYGSSDTIGGTAAGAGNVISGNEGLGIDVDGENDDAIQGNFIGTTASGLAPLGNLGDGIDVTESSDDTIGGTTAGAGNVIGFNSGTGVVIGVNTQDSSTGDSILTNQIYGNAGLGIDLGEDGVTLNDSSGHTGPNLFQDFPVITSAVTVGSMTTLDGTFTETPDTTYLVQFFSNPAADPSGYGQGQTYLTTADVLTNSMGVGTFSVPAPGEIAPGNYVTATATDPLGNTSEFSADTIVAQSNSVSWINPSGGDWDDPSNWSDDAVPTAGNDVSISIAVSNPITHSSAVGDAVNSLTSSDPIMLLAGSLTIGTTADLSARR